MKMLVMYGESLKVNAFSEPICVCCDCRKRIKRVERRTSHLFIKVMFEVFVHRSVAVHLQSTLVGIVVALNSTGLYYAVHPRSLCEPVERDFLVQCLPKTGSF